MDKETVFWLVTVFSTLYIFHHLLRYSRETATDGRDGADIASANLRENFPNQEE